VVVEVAHLRPGHAEHREAQQDRPLGPLVHDHRVAAEPGGPRLALVEQVDGADDGGARLAVGR
jgi:hypothetical protein